MNVCAVITIAMVMLLRHCGIIFMTVCSTLYFPIILAGQFRSNPM
jgi:hypothetical protein